MSENAVLYCVIVAMLNEVHVISVSKWLRCVHKSMDEFTQNEEILKSLRSMRMIALSNGCVTSIDDDTVFFPLSMFTDKQGFCFTIIVLFLCSLFIVR